MSPLPGQRSAQRPLQAMVASQRVLGRAAQAAAGGLGTSGIAFIDGQTFDVDLAAPAEERVRLVVDEPADSDEMTEQQERQG
ncbi:hypothetical protein ABZ593_20730 [Streptomyces sp. NPDC012617]|uniref:hypothetical protein n=1 Tax=Streptomyces TaxID=1883 RepID=UPI0033D33977